MTSSTRSTCVTAAATLLLALHWWLGVSGWFAKGVVVDETVHLVSGYSYWQFDDYRLQPENGNLPQRWGALPLLVEKPRLEPSSDLLNWTTSNVWGIGQGFFFESGNNTDFMLAVARAAMALWSVSLGALVFLVSRKLWGELGALFSLGLYAVSPTTLAHGPLVTSDMTAAFFLLAAPVSFWSWLEKPRPSSLALSLAMLGLASVAKFSFLVLGPIYALLLLAHFLLRRGDGTAFSGIYAGKLVGWLMIHVVVAWGVIWIFFGLRYGGAGSDMPHLTKYYVMWDDLVATLGGWRDILAGIKTWRLLPEAYVHGFAYVLHASQARGAFLAGHYGETGWWWFFPYAFLIKTPVAELLAYGLAASAIMRRLYSARRTWWILARPWVRRAMPLIILFGVYWVISLTSNLNIGHRHLLPIYAPLLIAAGALARPQVSRWAKCIAGALMGFAVVESTAARPDYLSYFNLTVGGSGQGWRHLVDSSLDWGQDLPGLSRWLATNRRPEETVYLSYFGSGDARYEGIEATVLAPYYYHYRPRYWEELRPGLYCISATMLQDPYSPWNGPWGPRHETAYQHYLKSMRAELRDRKRNALIEEFGNGPSKPLWNLDRLRFARLCTYLRLRRPDAMVANTILIYRVTEKEISTVVDGTPDELAALMTAAVEG